MTVTPAAPLSGGLGRPLVEMVKMTVVAVRWLGVLRHPPFGGPGSPATIAGRGAWVVPELAWTLVLPFGRSLGALFGTLLVGGALALGPSSALVP